MGRAASTWRPTCKCRLGAEATPQLPLGRRVGPARLHKVESLLLRGGGWALVVGRCTAGARVVLPGLAGMLGLRYRVFALWTGVAAMVWAVAHVLLGYAAGAGWPQVHRLTGQVGLLLAGAVLVALAGPPPGQAARGRASPAGRRRAAPRLGRRRVDFAQWLQVRSGSEGRRGRSPSRTTGSSTAFATVMAWSLAASRGPPRVDIWAQPSPGGRRGTAPSGPTTAASALPTVEAFSALCCDRLVEEAGRGEGEGDGGHCHRVLIDGFGAIVAVDREEQPC
jgi:hypothetical protein